MPRLALVGLAACGTPLRAAPRDGVALVDPDASIDAPPAGAPDAAPPVAVGSPLAELRHGESAMTGELVGLHPRGPTIRIAQPIVQGPIDRSIIRRYMRRHQNDVLGCYVARLAVAPNLLPGPLVARFVVVPRGAIAEASVIGFDPHVADCAAQRLEAIELPKFKSYGRVTITFTLENE